MKNISDPAAYIDETGTKNKVTEQSAAYLVPDETFSEQAHASATFDKKMHPSKGTMTMGQTQKSSLFVKSHNYSKKHQETNSSNKRSNDDLA